MVLPVTLGVRRSEVGLDVNVRKVNSGGHLFVTSQCGNFSYFPKARFIISLDLMVTFQQIPLDLPSDKAFSVQKRPLYQFVAILLGL